MSHIDDEVDQVEEKANPLVAIIICAVALALIAWGLHTLMGTKSGKKANQPKISLMTPPPPPPPPPPPKFEKKIEPPKDVKEIKEQQVQKAEPPAPTPELKMEGPAGNGPSSFASGKITSEDLSKMGTDKGALNNAAVSFNFNNYSLLMKSEMQRYLSKHSDLRHQQYVVELRVWMGSDGSLKRAELIQGTGDDATDALIKEALLAAPRFSEAPPANMPQPVRLRIVSSGRH